MTDDRDFDRIARAWLELAPDEAPDHSVAAVLQAIEVTPQVRPPRRWPSWRFLGMKRTAFVALGGATLVLVVGGGVWLNRSSTGTATPPPTTRPSPSAQSPAPSASASGASVIPAELRAIWMGEPREVADFGTSVRTSLKFTDSNFQLTGSDYPNSGLFGSAASVSTSGQLQLVLRTPEVNCQAGDTGLYSWSVSPTGSILTVVAAGADPCAARAAAVPGTWFRISTCKNTEDGCYGDLDPGTYKSQYITPRLPSGAAWQPDFGALTYTVPTGWANDSDWPDTFSLTPTSDYALEGPNGSPTGAAHSIGVYVDPAAAGQPASCANVEMPAVPRTVDGLIGYVRSLPSVVVGAAKSITVDGHPGKWIDTRMAPSWTKTCPGTPNQTPIAIMLMRHGGDQNAYSAGLVGPERLRLILVDLGGGRVVLITVDSTDPARFDELAAAAMPIIATFHFK